MSSPVRLHRAVRFMLVTVVLAGAAACPRAQQDPYLVRTTGGLLRGIPRSAGGVQFLGIPYAQPPVGPLRWRAPLPAKPWTGIRDAKTFASPCAQPVLEGNWNLHDAENGREDCLYLNVIVPAWPVRQPLPVMFWIHGGANHGGSGIGDLYNEGTLPGHGVVVVTINYRLGIFGFLAHPELTRESPHHASGDYGLMDQILALHWVRDNIAAFGGDEKNITVFGQSAGSMDAGALMTSPLARGLFQKVIAESGAAFAPAPPALAAAEQQGQDFAARLHLAPDAAGIAALRKIAAPGLIAQLGSLAQEYPGFAPDVDGWVLPRPPAQVFLAGEEAPVPLLIGTTSREFGNAGSGDTLRAAIERATGPDAPQALALYGLANGGVGTDDPTYGTAGQQWAADTVFHCPIAVEADWHAANWPTFEYELDHAIPGQEALGALHSADLPYVFGFFPAGGNIGGSFGAADTKLAGLIETYWTNFARSGDPNNPGHPSAVLPQWPRLGSSGRFLIFTQAGDVQLSAGPLRGPQCNLYRKELQERIKTGLMPYRHLRNP